MIANVALYLLRVDSIPVVQIPPIRLLTARYLPSKISYGVSLLNTQSTITKVALYSNCAGNEIQWTNQMGYITVRARSAGIYGNVN